MGDPAGRQRGLCCQHGRRAGGLSEAARSAASARVPRRNLEAADHRDAGADPREARTQGASRLRIRTQWRRQSVHGVRAAGRVAACQSHRPPHRHRLRPYAQGFVGRAFSRRGEDRAGAGQSQHPQARLTLRSLPRRRGTPARRALRVALHAQARQLARHGRIRTWRARVAVSESPHRRQANPPPRSQCKAGPPQQTPPQSPLAIQNRRCPRQAEETVPSLRVTRATNQFALPALTICALYRCRWQVELFFKWIKQHLRIKRFYGTSENAVRTQIWIAISVYVLVAIIKKKLRLNVSLHTPLQILSLTLFEKLPLKQAVAGVEPIAKNPTFHSQLNLFEF